MKWIDRNVPLSGRKNLSPWRSQALSMWSSASEACVHAVVEVKAEPMLRFLERHSEPERLTTVHFVIKAVGVILRQLPDINCLLRNGRLYRRRDADIFVPVSLDTEGHDLSFVVIRNVDTKTIIEIATELSDAACGLRKQTDVSFKPVRSRILRRPLIRLATFFLYSLNLWTPALGIPKNAFGSAGVTDASKFGADYIFPVFLPFTRLPFAVAVGPLQERYGPDGRSEKWLRLCMIVDHRVIDGVYVGRICWLLRAIWAAPEQYFCV